ncbi:actin-binding protein IPP [Planococcus citri]|uniref:actin-binding protein IPP n=1 Tax=Planococcus citri TaxID=170843 RepID=UPI0031F7C1EC
MNLFTNSVNTSLMPNVHVNKDFYFHSFLKNCVNNNPPSLNDSPAEFDYSSNLYPIRLIKNLQSLRKESRFCDVKISVQNEIFNAHRAVLSASSPYFYAMFNNGLKENGKDVIELHSLSSEIFNGLIDFIYSGSIRITRQNAQELIVAADMLQLTDLVTGCIDFFIKELDITNAVGIYRLADMHNFTNLAKSALEFIQNNFPLICQEEEFLELPKKYILELLSSEYLRVDSELQVFQSAIRWIHHKVDERRSFVFEILYNIRLPLLAETYVEQAINDCGDSSVKLALRSIWKDLFLKKGNLSPLIVQPRICAKKDIFVIGGSKREMISTWTRSSECTFETVEKFDTFKKCWSRVSSMGIGRILPGVTALNGKIFVVGGEQESQILANGECYDPVGDTWTAIDSMVVPRCEFGLAALHGYLYAIGGWVGDDIGGSIERYNPVLNEWKLYGNLPEPRFSMGVVSYEGLIYIVGGCTHSNRHHSTLLSYNPITGEWDTLASMLVPRSQMGVAILDNHLYVVGGTNKHHNVLHSVEKYSFYKNKWYKVPPMSVGRSSPAVAAVGGLLYVIGGDQTHEVNFYRAQITISSVEIFDPVAGVWKDGPQLPDSRSEAGAVVV